MSAHSHAAAYLLITEAAATIIAALIGAAAGIAVAWLALVLPESKKRPTLIADLLEPIAESVTQMIAMFEKEEIPHQAGHELYTTIAYFEKGTHQRFVSPLALGTSRGSKASRKKPRLWTYTYIRARTARAYELRG